MPMMQPAEIELAQVTKRYGDTVAVGRARPEDPGGTYCCLLGPSGCGKTTTLRMLAGHEAPSDGDMVLDGRTSPTCRRPAAAPR